MSDPRRRIDLAAIHVAKKNLALDDETYRAIIKRITRGRTGSSGEMKASERAELLDEFRRKGFQRPAAAEQARGGKSIGIEEGQHRKIVAMWIELAKAGVVKDSSDRALNHFVTRVTRVSHLKWLRAREANKVIEALKAMKKRVDGAADGSGQAPD